MIDYLFRHLSEDLIVTFHYYYLIKDRILDGAKIMEDIILTNSYKTPLIVLLDGSYIVQKGEVQTLFGEAYLFKDGNLIKICENKIKK